MPSINFSVFVDKILSGEKQQTIRKPRKVPIKVGDKLHLYTGQRTKECRKLGTAICSGIQTFRFVCVNIFGPHLAVYLTSGGEVIHHLDFQQVNKLAKEDGFEGYHDFQGFFIKTYNMGFEDRKEFVLIKWNNFVPEVENVNFIQG